MGVAVVAAFPPGRCVHRMTPGEQLMIWLLLTCPNSPHRFTLLRAKLTSAKRKRLMQPLLTGGLSWWGDVSFPFPRRVRWDVS